MPLFLFKMVFLISALGLEICSVLIIAKDHFLESDLHTALLLDLSAFAVAANSNDYKNIEIIIM